MDTYAETQDKVFQQSRAMFYAQREAAFDKQVREAAAAHSFVGVELLFFTYGKWLETHPDAFLETA